MICQAYLSYLREGPTETTFDIIFETENNKTAVSDVYRWVVDRNRCLPDVFTELLCVKIAEYPIGKIKEDGSLRTGMCWPFYEWKADYPYPFDGSIV